MIHFPTHYPSSTSAPEPGAVTKTENRSSSYSNTVVQEGADGSKTTISARLTSSYRYTETRYTASPVVENNTYEKPPTSAEAPNTAVASEQAAATGGVSNLGEADSVGAGVVLAFVEQRLANDLADGASKEELQSRLQAGLEGFIQGFNEAMQQLQEMGLYEGDVKTAVETMYNQVVGGFAELADKYELENPAADLDRFDVSETPENVMGTAAPAVPEAPLSPQDLVKDTVEAANQEAASLQEMLQPTTDFYTRQAEQDKEESEARLYKFELRTNDGDVVTIRSYADQGQREQTSTSSAGSSIQQDYDSLENFRFDVQGELDVDELKAVNGLLSQLNDVADTFFNGDVFDAYNKALEVGYDSDEIARFSLSLTQTEYSRVENTYGSVASAGADRLKFSGGEPLGQNRTMRMGAFMQQLNQINQHAKPFGFDPQLPDLAEFVAKPKHGGHPQFEQFRPFVAQMMSAFNRMHA